MTTSFLFCDQQKFSDNVLFLLTLAAKIKNGNFETLGQYFNSIYGKNNERIRNQYISSKVYEKESLESFAFSLGYGFAQTGDIYCEQKFIEGIKKCPPSGVNQAISKVFSRPILASLQVPRDTNLKKIKNEVQVSKIIQGDETPHKMLEGDTTRNWYLWGFFCTHACYFETHNTRSGDVIKDFLKDSNPEYLVIVNKLVTCP